MTTILKALVGSRAHGLNRPDSDWDWRGIFVQPTEEILSLGYSPKSVQWLEGREDFTNYEIGHFLMLATKANPSVLELMASPKFEHIDQWGIKLCDLFPYLFDPRDAYNAFTGYSLNQRKKFLDDKDGRKWKYALAYIRTLDNLNTLLETGTFSLTVDPRSIEFTVLEYIRDGKKTPGDIINLATSLQMSAEAKLEKVQNRKDPDKVNNFLLDIRRAFWVQP